MVLAVFLPFVLNAQEISPVKQALIEAAKTLRYPDSGNPVFPPESEESRVLSNGMTAARLPIDRFEVFMYDAARGADHNAQATLTIDDQRLNGADVSGQIRLFAPNPAQPGSSISHFDTGAEPNLLMEPSINSDIPFMATDLADELLYDIGWLPGSSGYRFFRIDGPAVGLDDRSPFTPVGGNPATELGEARLNVFEAVGQVWGNLLGSSAPIDVLVSFSNLPCGSGGAALAAAGTVFVYRDDSFPFANTWYHSALTESFTGMDLAPVAEDGGDLMVFVNAAIDDECLGEGTGFYYGLDGNAPPNQLDLFTVLLHEVAHGVGFANFTNETNGFFIQGFPGIFDRFTFDLDRNQTWAEMTAEERVQSAVNTSKVVWSGPSTTMETANVLAPGVPIIRISNDPPINGDREVGLAAFGPAVSEGDVTGTLVCADDMTGDPQDACEAINDDLTGSIALTRRGTCPFTTKAEVVEAAGANGVVIVNNVPGGATPLGGLPDNPITIPAVSLSKEEGDRLIDLICFGILFNDSFD